MLIEFPRTGAQPEESIAGQALPDLITVPEAAQLIGLHADTLYRLCRTGQFDPAIQIGARWRVSVPRLERYLHGDAAEN
jgi:excisionase family DNA binding protein